MSSAPACAGQSSGAEEGGTEPMFRAPVQERRELRAVRPARRGSAGAGRISPWSIRGLEGEEDLFARFLPCVCDHPACPEGGRLRRGRGGQRGSLQPPRRQAGESECCCRQSGRGPGPAFSEDGLVPARGGHSPLPGPATPHGRHRPLPADGSVRAAAARTSAPREEGSVTEAGTDHRLGKRLGLTPRGERAAGPLGQVKLLAAAALQSEGPGDSRLSRPRPRGRAACLARLEPAVGSGGWTRLTASAKPRK